MQKVQKQSENFIRHSTQRTEYKMVGKIPEMLSDAFSESSSCPWKFFFVFITYSEQFVVSDWFRLWHRVWHPSYFGVIIEDKQYHHWWTHQYTDLTISSSPHGLSCSDGLLAYAAPRRLDPKQIEIVAQGYLINTLKGPK